MLSRSANDLLCILMDAGVVVNCRGVFSLRFYESSANLDGVEFIGANSAIADLIVPLLGIEVPPAIGSYQGNGHRPVVSANRERSAGGILWIRFQLNFFTGPGHKRLDILLVANRIGRRYKVFAFRAEDSLQPRQVVGRGPRNKCVYGFARGRESL